jgi:hypothetical protein
VLNRVSDVAQAAAQKRKFEIRHIADGSLHETWFVGEA